MAPQTPRMKNTTTPNIMYSLTLTRALTAVVDSTPTFTAPMYSLYSSIVTSST